MERLTEVVNGVAQLTLSYDKGRWSVEEGPSKFPGAETPRFPRFTICGEAIDRLAAYEETGLEPEQIIRARDTLECFDNIGIKRGNEIVKAEQEGRLVVLPCKVGDTVYFHTYAKNATVDLGIQPHEVTATRAYVVTRGEFSDVGHLAQHFGKTVFLTREEAEKALRGGSSDDP